jgi:hypothetical protein
MKKSISAIICITLVISLSACTGNSVAESPSGSDNGSQMVNAETQPTLPPVDETATDAPPTSTETALHMEKRDKIENAVFSVKTQAEAAGILIDAIEVFADKITFDLSKHIRHTNARWQNGSGASI